MIKAVWGRAIVRPKAVEETDETFSRAKQLGIEIPKTQEREMREQSQIEGTLVSVGGNCFEEWKGDVPKQGDHVIYDKFAGFVKDIDGVEHRIISDTDILGVIDGS